MSTLFNIPLSLYLGNSITCTNSFVSVFVGASILAAQFADRAIVALEGDKELYEELLQPLQVATLDS
jgi:hypothetical protein